MMLVTSRPLPKPVDEIAIQDLLTLEPAKIMDRHRSL
jgi:hypothetical protein